MKIRSAVSFAIFFLPFAAPFPAYVEESTPSASTKRDESPHDAALQKYLSEFDTQTPMKKVKPGEKLGGLVRSPEFFKYTRKIREIFQSKVRWEDKEKVLQAAVSAEIERSGEIKNVILSQSSGNSAYDEMIIGAVRMSSPLPPPPIQEYEMFKKVRLSFDSRDE